MIVYSGNLWNHLKEDKSLVVFDGECRMAPEPMQGNQASSRVDLGYRKPFCVAAVTSGSLQTCDSFLLDSLELQQGSQDSFHVDIEHRIALHAMHSNRATFRSKVEVSWIFSSFGGNLWYILELWHGKPFKIRL